MYLHWLALNTFQNKTSQRETQPMTKKLLETLPNPPKWAEIKNSFCAQKVWQIYIFWKSFLLQLKT